MIGLFYSDFWLPRFQSLDVLYVMANVQKLLEFTFQIVHPISI